MTIKPTKYIQDMTREELEFQLAEADFQFGGWFSTKERLKRENAALESQVRDLTGELKRSKQLEIEFERALDWIDEIYRRAESGAGVNAAIKTSKAFADIVRRQLAGMGEEI